MAIEVARPSIVQRAAAAIARAAGLQVTTTKALRPKTEPPYATSIRAMRDSRGYGKRGARLLRNFSENNEWVRAAINRRKHALSRAKWNIVRLDDIRKAPDPAVVKRVRDLFAFVNPTRESFGSFLMKLVEDILVLDAGCIEKVHTVGGDLTQLWPVDGATITVDGRWELTANPNSPRYYQFEQFKKIADLYNDQLIYIMHNPRTNTPIGWSPVETLVRVIEAELYAENYDFDYLKQLIPEGMIDLGPGVSKPELDAFREYYETDIAGSRSVAIIGGGGGPGDEAKPGTPTARYTEFTRSDNFETRLKYKKYLATKIATVFEMDISAMNIVENVNRANAKTGQEQSDTGLVGLAWALSEPITREILWELDPDHLHGFVFDGIVPRDEMSQAKIDQIYMQIGVVTPNEIRARDGLPPVEWGDEPYNAQGSATPDPLDEDAAREAGWTPPDEGDGSETETENKGATRRALVPFGRGLPVTRRTPARRRSSTGVSAG